LTARIHRRKLKIPPTVRSQESCAGFKPEGAEGDLENSEFRVSGFLWSNFPTGKFPIRGKKAVDE
jgi:hypothetical protein